MSTLAAVWAVPLAAGWLIAESGKWLYNVLKGTDEGRLDLAKNVQSATVENKKKLVEIFWWSNNSRSSRSEHSDSRENENQTPAEQIQEQINRSIEFITEVENTLKTDPSKSIQEHILNLTNELRDSLLSEKSSTDWKWRRARRWINIKHNKCLLEKAKDIKDPLKSLDLVGKINALWIRMDTIITDLSAPSWPAFAPAPTFSTIPPHTIGTPVKIDFNVPTGVTVNSILVKDSTGIPLSPQPTFIPGSKNFQFDPKTPGTHNFTFTYNDGTKDSAPVNFAVVSAAPSWSAPKIPTKKLKDHDIATESVELEKIIDFLTIQANELTKLRTTRWSKITDTQLKDTEALKIIDTLFKYNMLPSPTDITKRTMKPLKIAFHPDQYKLFSPNIHDKIEKLAWAINWLINDLPK